MSITQRLVELVFSAALFVNALLFIPQALRIISKKNSNDVSFMTFFGFLLIQLTTVLHGLINNDLILVVGYLLSMLTCGTVVVLILFYRYRN